MRLVIIGAGFAGMYAALSAARLRDIQGVSPEQLQIALVAPEPTLVVRPRLYEPKPETLTAPLLDVLKAIDVVYVQGSAETIDTKSRTVSIVADKGAKKSLSYDRLVVATGSRLFRPNVPGLAEHGFSVDSLDDATALDKHLHGLADRPPATPCLRSGSTTPTGTTVSNTPPKRRPRSVRLLRELAETGELLVATHMPFPSVGHVAVEATPFVGCR